METIRLNGRAVQGFGLGAAAAPMTVQEAASVPRGWPVPFLIGFGTTIGSMLVGAMVGRYAARNREEAETWMGGGMLLGIALGSGVGGSLAAGFGHKQQRAAEVLAQAQQSMPAAT